METIVGRELCPRTVEQRKKTHLESAVFHEVFTLFQLGDTTSQEVIL